MAMLYYINNPQVRGICQAIVSYYIYIYIRPKKTRFQCQLYGSNSFLLHPKRRRIAWFLSSSYESKLLILCSPKNKPFLLVRAPTTGKEERNNQKSLERGKKKKIKNKQKNLQLYQSFLFQMPNITGDEGSFSSGNTGEEVHQEKQQQQLQHHLHGSSSAAPGASNSNSSTSQQQPVKKKRNLPGTPGKFNHPKNLSHVFSAKYLASFLD